MNAVPPAGGGRRRGRLSWRFSESGLWTRPYLSLWLFQVLSGVLIAPIFSLFAIYVEQGLGLSASLASLVRGSFVALGGLMALPAGSLCASLGPRRAYLLSLSGLVASSLVFTIHRQTAHGLEAMWGLAVYAGLMGGLASVAGQSYMMGAVPRSSLGLATAGYFMALTLGNALGNLWGGRVADWFGYAALGWIAAAAVLLLMVGACMGLPELARTPADAPGKPQTGYGRLAQRPEIWILLALRFFPTCYWGAVTFVLPLIIFDAARTNRAAADYQTVALAMSAVSQVISGRLCDRGYRTVVMIVGALGITMSALGLTLTYRSLAGLYLFGAGGAMLAWMLSTTMPGIVRDLSAATERSRLLAATHFAWSAGFVAGTLIAGHLRDHPGAILQIATGCGALALCLVLLLLPFLRRAETREGREEPLLVK